MAYLRPPNGMNYNIHGHNGNNGREREPHCHILCAGKRISIAIKTGMILAGEGQLDKVQERNALRWVKQNSYELMKEWEDKQLRNGKK